MANRHSPPRLALVLLVLVLVAAALRLYQLKAAPSALHTDDPQFTMDVESALAEGERTFRYDTFGDEDFWGGQLRLHDAIRGAKLGGVGGGLSPKAALGLGLKVDADALPADLVAELKRGKVNLDDPAVTVALLKQNAVVGVQGFFKQDRLVSVGVTCAICHSVVDDSLAPGIGHRRDGWANRDLNIGGVIALAPNLKPLTDLLGVNDQTVRKVLAAWGPGKFDAQLVLDGKGFRTDGKTSATLIPPAFGLAGVNLHTSTAFGSVPYWNAFVAVLEMHGNGSFADERLNNPTQFPIAAKAGLWNVRMKPDLVSPKLPTLHLYQLALVAPKPPAGSYNTQAAARGKTLFEGKARCATCHVPPTFTEPGYNMHRAEEIGIDNFQASRSPNGRYRTAPLRGLWTHQKGGFYHDGRFATLADVVEHYQNFLHLNLSAKEQQDLVEYLKSL